MSAVKAIRYLLANSAPLLAQVPATRILAGILPEGTAAPAVALTHVSTTRPQAVTAPTGMAVSRVQVTVVAANYPQLRAILPLVRGAVPRSRGTVNGVAVDSILIDSEGPDFADEAGLCVGSIDFIVRFTE